MGLLLSIETSTTNCSVALGLDGKLIAIQENDSQNYSHSEKLHLFITKVMKKSGYSLTDLDAVAVSKGPGSYTGLRIGVSAAKGLCFSTDTPLIAIDTLAVLAAQVPQDQYNYIIPLLDARRMEAYTAVFYQGKKTGPTISKVLDSTSFKEEQKNDSILFVGNAISKYKKLLDQSVGMVFKESNPSAKEMVTLAEKKFKSEDFEDLAYFEPYYLKDFMAKKKKADK